MAAIEESPTGGGNPARTGGIFIATIAAAIEESPTGGGNDLFALAELDAYNRQQLRNHRQVAGTTVKGWVNKGSNYFGSY